MRKGSLAFWVAVLAGMAFGSPALSATGRTAGSFNVTPAGAATYAIPIFTPPGPRGMQPGISLVYSSDAGIGPVGKGWAIAGLSAITRCNRTLAQDGISFSIQLQATDQYCLNGNRLRITGGTQGAAGSTYQTEIADFSQVTAVGTAGNGPASFTVQGRDGLTYEYGTDSTSQVLATGTSTVSMWMLRQISDRSSNRVRFTYVAAGSGLTGTTNPSTIEWTATTSGGSTFLYSMTFTYGSNTPPSSQAEYVAGTAVANSQLLTNISVSNNGSVVRKYFLAYNTSPTTGVYRLQTVTECNDSAGSDCLLPTSIGYQNGQAGVVSSSVSGNVVRNADFNADGIADALYASGGALYVTWGTPSGSSSPVSVGASAGTELTGDLLGDGQDVILVAQSGTWYSYRWNGSSFSSVSTGVSVAGSTTYFLADANGDGKKDLFSAAITSSSPLHYGLVSYRLSTSSGGSISFASPTSVGDLSPLFSGAFMWTDFPLVQGSYPGRYNSYDLNGDSRDDLIFNALRFDCYPYPNCYPTLNIYALIAQPNGTYALTVLYTVASASQPTIKYVRFNDDACTDLVIDWGTGSTQVALSACNGSTAAYVSTTGYFRGVIDWDGDGRLDLLTYISGSTLSVSLSTATGFASPTATSVPNSCAGFAADVNGDGLDDLGCGSSGTIPYYLHNGAGTRPDLAASFTDGYGVNQTVTYQPATWNYHTKQSGSVYPNKDYAAPMQLVGNVNHTDGIGGTYNRSYWYYGAAMNVAGRGFAGFASRKITDSRTSAYTIDYFNRDFPYTGTLAKTEAYQAGGTLISRLEVTLNTNTLDATTNNQRYFIYPTPIGSSTYEVGGAANGNLITETSESRTYDGWGNVTALSRTVTDKDSSSPYYNYSWSQSASFTIYPDSSSNWCLGVPSASSVTHSTTTGEPSVTHNRTFTPDYAHCRISAEVVEPSGGNRRVDTSYGFDSYGNVNSVSVTGRTSAGSTMSARTSSITWGSANGSSGGTGQFPVAETNPLSQTTTRTFHSTFGHLATETDPNGIVVASNTYDSFGRLASQTQPDGTFRQYTYALLSGCCNPLGIDYIQMTSFDAGSSAVRNDFVFRDKLGRMINEYHSQLSGSGYSTLARTYDALGRVSTEAMPFQTAGGSQYSPAYVTSYTYDLLGRVTQTSRPTSQSLSTPVTTTFGYAGRTRTVTDAQSKVSTKILDVNGWLRRSQDHNGYYQAFGYDANGGLKQVTDSLGNTLFTASYSYGIQAFQDSSTDMDLGTRNYSHNSLGELTGWSDAKSQTFSLSYDSLSRVTSRTEAEGTTTWTWGTSAASRNIGRLASVSMSGYSEAYTYDSIGRLSQQSITAGSTYNIGFAYNTQGLLDVLTYPTSTASTRVKVKYGYAYGLLQSVTDWTSGSAGTVYWTANSQNSRGQTTQETLGNGVVTTRSIDAVTGWTSSIQSGAGGGAGLQNQSYLYDLVGNVTQRQESNLGLTENFYYDNLYRLSYSQLNAVTNLSLTYDAMGNIQSRSDVNAGATWTYHATKKHAVASTGAGGYTYGYDANGNMSSRNGATISWASYDYPTGLAAGSESTTIYYDPQRQYYKQVYSGPSGTETTHYLGGILEKVDLPGGLTDWRHYVQAQGQTVAIVSRLSTGTNTVSYPLEDHLGSAAVLTSSAGASIVKESFGAFGLPRNGASWSGAVPAGDKALIAGLTRRGYTFHSMLGDMGLIHMNGRVQDAITGRFLSPDPTVPNPGFTQSFNRYAYVNNNPLSFVDPSGFTPTCTEALLQWICPPGVPLTELDETVVRGTRSPGSPPPDSTLAWTACRLASVLFANPYFCQGMSSFAMDPGAGAATAGASDSTTTNTDPAPIDDTTDTDRDKKPQETKEEIPPCRMEVDDGNWSTRFGGYFGAGFEFSFGEDNGNFFFTTRVGFGLGGGISWSPRGRIPGPEPVIREHGSSVLSASSRASASWGPFGVSREEGIARNYGNEESDTYYRTGGSFRGAHSRGASFGGSVGAEWTTYSRRTSHYASQGTCRAHY